MLGGKLKSLNKNCGDNSRDNLMRWPVMQICKIMCMSKIFPTFCSGGNN